MKNSKKWVFGGIIMLAFILIIIIFANRFKVDILDDDLVMSYGDVYQLNYDCNVKDLQWESSNPDLIKVDETGKVSFLSNVDGNVTITVRSKFGFQDTINIKSLKRDEVVLVESVELDDCSDILLESGDTFVLNANIYPSDATNQAVTYVSSKPESVKIDSSGKVTVLNDDVDSVIISVITNENAISSSVKLSFKNNSIINDNVTDENVNKPITGAKISNISFTKNEITINTGDYYSLQSLLIVEPANISYSYVKWMVPQPDDDKLPIISVDDETGVVRGIRGGTATVYAKSVTGNVEAKIKVNVKNPNKIVGSILRVQDRKIVKDVNGKAMPVVLKGLNIGAWLSRSYSMSNFAPLDELAVRNNFYYPNSTSLENESCINNLSFYGALSSNADTKKLLESKFKNNTDAFVNTPGVKEKYTYDKISELINNSTRKESLKKSEIIELSNTLYDNFITEEDFDIIAQMGANVVRLPIEYSFFSKERTIKDALNYIEKIVNMAGERGIYVILDLHLVEGRQNSGGYCGTAKFYDKYDVSKDSKTVDLEFQKYMSDLWGHIAYKFEDNVFVAGYELLNEPEGNLAKLVNYYNSAYKAIRKYDKNHIIIMDENCVVCGYTGASKNRADDNVGDLPDPSKTYLEMKKEGKIKDWRLAAYVSKDVKWDNVVYSTHDYTYKSSDQSEDKYNGNDINLLLDRLKEKLINVNNKSKEYNVPYYVGEFSYYGTTEIRSKNSDQYEKYLKVWSAAMDLYEKYGFSYTPWTYKANNELYYGLVFYGTKNKSQKADLINDSYSTLKTKFSYKSYDNMKFNEDFYYMFLNQFNSKRVVDSIKLESNRITMKVNDQRFVNATVGPNTAINKKLYWDVSPDSKNIINVDRETGLIKAVGVGEATIIVGNYPLEKYVDSENFYKCTGKLPNKINDTNINEDGDYRCELVEDENLNKNLLARTVELKVTVVK